MSSSIGSVFTSLKKKSDEIAAAKRKARELKSGKKRVGHGQYVSTNSNNNSGKNNNNSGKNNNNKSGPVYGPQNQTFVPFLTQADKDANAREVAARKQKNKNVSKKNNNKIKTTKAKTKAEIIKEHEAEKSRVKNIVDSSKKSISKAKAELDAKNKAAADKTKAVEEAERKKSAVVGKTRKDIRREARDDKKARRRAGRTAKQALKTPGGSITDEQNQANIAAEKAKIAKRREGRNQFLRNFGSQLTRGVQAGPKEGFKDNKSGINFYDDKKNNASTQSSSSEATPQSPEQKEFENYANMQFDSISSKMGLTQDYDNQNLQNAGFGLGSYKSSDYMPTFNPSQEKEEDSNPSTAMMKIYKQKRGY